MKPIKNKAEADRITSRNLFYVKETSRSKWVVEEVTATTIRMGYNICLMIKTPRGEAIANWDHLFETEEEAQKTADLYNETIKSFNHTPLIDIKNLVANKEIFINIQNSINEKLKDHPNFDGIDFCDVNANGIQIRLHHKQIKGYTLSDQATLNYDLTNVEEVIDKSVKNFTTFDTEENIKGYQEFIADGDKYGWD